jgi:hypothetical protein
MDGLCEMMLQGADVEVVIDRLRKDPRDPSKTRSLAGLSCAIADLRARLLPMLPAPDLSSLTHFAKEDGVATFLTLSLAEMIQVQRTHEYVPSWSDEAELALSQLQLVPSNIAGLRMSKRDQWMLARKREQALLKKQESLLRVSNARQWLEHAILLARQSSVEMTAERLALPILLLCGRRTTEVLNGRSTFIPTVRATTCVFVGALKKRGNETAPVEIPLLCDFATFDHALRTLRQQQEHRQFESVACNNLYHRRLQSALVDVFPFATNPHQLRAVYAQMVHHVYMSDVTFNRAAMRILGHGDLITSLSYNNVELLDFEVEAGCFGPLP